MILGVLCLFTALVGILLYIGSLQNEPLFSIWRTLLAWLPAYVFINAFDMGSLWTYGAVIASIATAYVGLYLSSTRVDTITIVWCMFGWGFICPVIANPSGNVPAWVWLAVVIIAMVMTYTAAGNKLFYKAMSLLRESGRV